MLPSWNCTMTALSDTSKLINLKPRITVEESSRGRFGSQNLSAPWPDSTVGYVSAAMIKAYASKSLAV